jgi:hypothetical protein
MPSDDIFGIPGIGDHTVPEDKSLTYLRRKFLIGIPSFGILGWMGGKLLADHFALSKWSHRGCRIACMLLGAFTATTGIVYFNQSEIFRIGNSMMRQMEMMRESKQGPFVDPQMCERWDEQMANRRITRHQGQLEDFNREYTSTVDYSKVVNEATRM